jgi:hypothetical protein
VAGLLLNVKVLLKGFVAGRTGFIKYNIGSVCMTPLNLIEQSSSFTVKVLKTNLVGYPE